MIKKIMCLALLGAMFVMATGCSNGENKTNYLGGKGEIKNSERENGLWAVYDDEYKYFTSYDKALLRLDKNGNLTVNCDVATCGHSLESCKGNAKDIEYFVFNDRLYKSYNEPREVGGMVEYKGSIIDCESGKVVFDNPIPEDMSEEDSIDDSTEVSYVRVLNDDIVKVEGPRHAYLLDKDFNVLYWHSDTGKFPWGTIYDNTYYYINDLYQLIAVDMNTYESSPVELDTKIFMCDRNGDYLYFTDKFEELYRYSLKDGSKQKLGEGIIVFSLLGDYIYWCNNDIRNILDLDGKLVCDCSDYTKMEFDCLIRIEDKVYTIVENGVAEMDLDGKNYKEYTYK
ncbi:MAG: hypothetical protein IJC76_08625 [Lachnospiraceae bacterium]|nr:hypothetical protein [Lachnospiraceae bacterium]